MGAEFNKNKTKLSDLEGMMSLFSFESHSRGVEWGGRYVDFSLIPNTCVFFWAFSRNGDETPKPFTLRLISEKNHYTFIVPGQRLVFGLLRRPRKQKRGLVQKECSQEAHHLL